MTNAHEYIKAARCPADMPEFQSGLRNCKRYQTGAEAAKYGCKTYMALCEVNMHGLHRVDDEGFGGHVIMEDTPLELRKHLPIFMHGHGRILKTGLGLGCVVRGLLSKPSVDHIDVIENDPRIIAYVGPEFENNPRVTIHEGDALSVNLKGQWDFAWHDIYCEGNDGLAVLHAELISRFMDRANVQGAWAFPREAAKRYPVRLLGSPNYRSAA